MKNTTNVNSIVSIDLKINEVEVLCDLVKGGVTEYKKAITENKKDDVSLTELIGYENETDAEYVLDCYRG